MTPLAITGFGVVSSVGVGRKAWVHALSNGATNRNLVGTPTVFASTRVPDAKAAEVWGFDPKAYLGDKGLRNFDRLTTFIIVASKHALEDAGLKKDSKFIALEGSRVGICFSTAYGSLDAITELNMVAELEDPRYINPARFPNTVINAAAGYVSIWEDLRAPNTTIVDGNCGALDAVLTCETHLRHQRADAFVVGGGEVLSEPLYLAFRRLGALAEGDALCLPGNPKSGGMIMGEGAAAVCVERLDEAKARGASVCAEILGYGTAFHPPESEARIVHGSSLAVERAMRGALADANMNVSDIHAVCSAVGGIAEIDGPELQAIESVFGKEMCVAAPKVTFGEVFGAFGSLGLAATLAWFEGAPVGPLVGGKPCDEVRNVMINTVGFYGNVSSVVVRNARA